MNHKPIVPNNRKHVNNTIKTTKLTIHRSSFRLPQNRRRQTLTCTVAYELKELRTTQWRGSLIKKNTFETSPLRMPLRENASKKYAIKYI